MDRGHHLIGERERAHLVAANQPHPARASAMYMIKLNEDEVETGEDVSRFNSGAGTKSRSGKLGFRSNEVA
jgi:hypothetical protein